MQGLTYVPPSAFSSASVTSTPSSLPSSPPVATAEPGSPARVSSWVVLFAVFSIFAPLFFVFLGVVCAGLCSQTRTTRSQRWKNGHDSGSGGGGDGTSLSDRSSCLSGSTGAGGNSHKKSEYPPGRTELNRFETVDLEAGPTEGQLPMYTR